MLDVEKKEAVEKVMAVCDSLMENYTFVSLRNALQVRLGYSRDDTDEIIRWVADKGFSYCVDPIITTSFVGGEDREIAPSYDVCFWGPDQLRSRLSCCRY
jgi:hypothetical protein